MNVQHTIPTLDDNGTIIVDSHVICGYLVDKFGDSDRLYPKDVASRALVDARMFFDAGVFAKIRMITDYVFFAGITEIPEEKVEFAQRSWTTLNRMVEKTPYVCGDDMTIADLCLVASVSSMTQIAPLDLERHAAVLEWIHRMEQLPYYEEANGNGAKGKQYPIDTIDRWMIELRIHVIRFVCSHSRFCLQQTGAECRRRVNH